TIQNLTDQVQSLEKELQETKDNSAELSCNEDIILENKRLKKELDYYVGRARYALYGKDAAWAEKNGYRISDIPAFDDEDDDEDPMGLPTITEDIPQHIPVIPSNSRAHIMSKNFWNGSQVIHEAGIPAIGGYHPPPKQKRIIADPPTSITGVLPKPLGKSRAERWDQPAFRGASEWILEQDVHDAEMRRLYAEAKALPPHQRTPDHTAVMFRIDEYARSLPGLPRNLVARHDGPNWMTDVIQSFNSNPSGVPQNRRLEGLHVNVDDTDIWYWYIFSSIGRWEKLVAGRWKRSYSPFLCSPVPARFEIPRKQKLDSSEFAYWANEMASLKGGAMNHFRVHDNLLPLVQGSPFYSPPTVGEPMDQDESDPEHIPIQHTGSSSLADRLDYGEGGSFSKPPSEAHELRAHSNRAINHLSVLKPKRFPHPPSSAPNFDAYHTPFIRNYLNPIMSTSATPALTPFSQNMTPLPGFDTDRSVTIHWIVRDISPPHATLMPPRTFRCTELIQLSSFQFQPPYARDQYVVVFNQFYMLTARIPIAWQDIDNEMDFLAVLVHREGSLEETVMIPVPASFFEDHFLPDDPSSSSPSPSLSPSRSPSSPRSPSSTIVPNSSLPIPHPTSVTIAEPPSTHDYPPTRHIAQQLGEAPQSLSWTWKELMEELWMYIFIIGLGLLIIGVLALASTFH
ncbi:hypothetical protein M422DRAFT_265333, partial [Sphaerobolus stellatus SS14]